MNQLRQKIRTLDQQPTQKYSALTGRYTDADIVYYLRNVYGGTVKKCSLEIELPKKRLYDDIYQKRDAAPISSYILRDFYGTVWSKNGELQLSDKRQKGFFIPYPISQRVLANNIVTLEADMVRIRLELKLPANTSAFEGSLLAMNTKLAESKLKKRKKDIISSKALGIFLLKNLPELVEDFIDDFSKSGLHEAVVLYRNQEYIRSYLRSNGYVSFLGNGSVLPRIGPSDCKNPRGHAFLAPPSLELTIPLPDGGSVSGLGIKSGVTVILGDAYHGKSTLLSAIYEGIYNHIGGDGREYVITCESALKISAENGRSVQNTDISFYLSNLPESSCDAKHFSTANASGSTSQAAAVVEAVESGCKLMLLDEDNCANNFMYREERMREIFGSSSTVPFLDHAQSLYSRFGISTILAAGASAEYLKAADHALLIQNYEVCEFTDYEKTISSAENFPLFPRKIDLSGLRRPDVIANIAAMDTTLKIGTDHLDMSAIIPNVSSGQMNFIVHILKRLITYENVSGKTLMAALDAVFAKPVPDSETGYLEYVRKYDIMQILYRCKKIRFR